MIVGFSSFFFFFQAEDGIRDVAVTGVQTCALPISNPQVAGLSAEEGAKIAASVAALQEAAAGSDYKLIRKRIDELNHATEHLAELLMNSAVSTALEGRKLAEV